MNPDWDGVMKGRARAPKPPDVDHKGRPYTLPPADPATLAPWLAPDGSGGLLLLVGTTTVATLDARVVAELKAAARDGRTYRVVLEAS